jgi:hypothetical protein
MPPAIITPSLLHSLRANQHLPPQTWYFISGVALSILNRPDEIPKVFQHAIEQVPFSTSTRREEEFRVARRMREALVKASAIGGLPKVHSRPNTRLFSWLMLSDHQCSSCSEECLAGLSDRRAPRVFSLLPFCRAV